MNLRICDGERERIVPASIEVVEQAFATGVPMHPGTEITAADGERWLVALAFGSPVAGRGGEAEEFLLSGDGGENGASTGRVSRREALRRFREFVLARRT
jgi:hypothetical protein